MCSERDDAALPAPGSPIRESTGHRPFNASPWLFAVVHALHRLLVPRHPPCALTILTVISRPGRTSAGPMLSFTTCQRVRFSRTGEERVPQGTPEGRSLKTQQREGRGAAPTQARSTFQALAGRSEERRVG